MTQTEQPIDVINKHLKNRQNIKSFSLAVQEVMDMKAVKVKSLLKDLIVEPVELSHSAVVNRLAAAYLIQVEMKHRVNNDFTSSLLPFHIADYKDAIAYGKEKEPIYSRILPEESEDGEDGEVVVKVKGKRGRKGGTFDKVKDYVKENPDMLEKSYDAKKATQKIADDLEIAYNTALNYLYKCRRLHKTGDF